MISHGCFITFEGGDGAGKTTLIASVEKALLEKGCRVLRTRAPGGTELGQAIRHLLLSHNHLAIDKLSELFLFLADRVQHTQEIIRPALQKGEMVLCDRFNDSTVAYQSAARGLDKAFVQKLCALATHDLQPNLTLYLDIDPQIGLERALQGSLSQDRIEAEGLKFHNTIRKAYQKIAEEEPSRVKVLNAAESKEEIFQKAMRYIDALC